MHSAPDISVRNAVIDDASTIVNIHLKSFEGFFLTFLGPQFLQELYMATLEDSEGIGIVAIHQGMVGGFVTGTVQPAGFYRRLVRQRWWRFGLAAIQPMLKKPSIVPRLLRAFSAPGQVTQTDTRGLLMSIAVLPEVQGKGVGKSLVAAFLEEASRRGLKEVELSTDKENNDSTNRFYQNLGFSLDRTYATAEGRMMNDYVISLLGQDSGEHIDAN